MSSNPHSSAPARVSGRYSAFDLMRFTCAVLVVIGHSAPLIGVRLALQHAMLSVDTFFMISGYLLHSRYAAKFVAGARARDLAFERLLRILPIAYLALALGGVVMAVTSARPDIPRLMLKGLAGLAMLPCPSLTGAAPIAPLDIPFWTLIWEVWINLLLIFAWRRLRGPVIPGVIAVTGTVAVLAARAHGNFDYGFQVKDLATGAARAAFAFFIGVAIAKYVSPRWRAPAVPAWAVLAGLLLVMAIGVPASLGWLYEFAAVTLLLPLIVWAGGSAHASPRMVALAAVLGQLYYGVYAFHGPAIGVEFWLSHETGLQPSPWLLAPLALGVGLLSHLVSRSVDPWARRQVRALWARGVSPRAAGAPGLSSAAGGTGRFGGA